MSEEERRFLADVQMEKPAIALPVDRAGIRGLKRLLRVQDRERGSQTTMADISLAADLPPTRKGAHMSRFVEAVDAFDETLTTASLRSLLQNVRAALGASRSFARFSFPFLARKVSPAAGRASSVACGCAVSGELDGEKLEITLETAAPIMTVCPCSLAISQTGAHSQRAEARLELGLCELPWIEEFIEISEEGASCAVYSLLKRDDEKMVTERAFSRPMFVEDVVRSISDRLRGDGRVLWFRAEVESLESIHGHNAFAAAGQDKRAR